MKTLLLSALLLVALTGCMTFSTTVNRETVPTTFRRILVVSRLQDPDNRETNEYARAFPADYSVCTLNLGGLNKLSFASPDSLIQNEIRACKPDVILSIGLEPVQGTYSRVGPVASFYFEMSRVVDGKAFWKAIEPGYAGMIARQVVVRLQKDGLITGQIPPASASDSVAR